MSNPPNTDTTISKKSDTVVHKSSLRDFLKKKKWDCVSKRLETHEEETKFVDKNGRLPLHFACLYGAPPQIIEKLLIINPEAATFKDKNGNPPLFFYLNCLAPPLDAVELVINANPTALSTKWFNKNLPIYAAFVIKVVSSDLFALIVKATPKREHAYFIRWACEFATSSQAEKMEVLLSVINSKALCKADSLGRLPLHIACDNPHLSKEFVVKLRDKYPRGALVRNKKGLSPNLFRCMEHLSPIQE